MLSCRTTVFSKIIIALALLLAPLPGWATNSLAQNPISARVDRTRLAVNEQLVLTVTVTGDFLTIPQPDLSQIQGFVVVNSSTSTQVSIVNGKMTSQGVYIYRLQPLAEGAAQIAPISINLNGQVFQTNPIEIEVQAAGSATPAPAAPNPDTPANADAQDYFVQAVVDNDHPYLGQQVIYTFRFFQAVNFFGQPDYRPPTFTDFWSRQLTDQPHYNSEVKGRNYLVTEIRTALFPAYLGKLTIDPARLVVPGGMFEEDIKLEAPAVAVNVKPLPDKAPADFNGAVGQFQIRASLNKTESKVNEPLTLRIEIEGQGNIETIAEPKLAEIANWRYFESQSDTKIDTSREALSGIRSFERLVVPGQAGALNIPPISFSFYNPKTEAYETVSTQPIAVNITPDDSTSDLPLVAGKNPAQQPVELLAADIQHIKPTPYTLSTPRVFSLVAQVAYWSGWVLPLFAIGAALVWKRRQLRLERDPALARSLSARKRALSILTAAGNDAPGAAGRALLGYLSDKLDAPTAGLTTDELLRLLATEGLAEPLVSRVKNVLLQVDFGRFAPISAGDEQSLLAETRSLLNDLEKAFGAQ